MINPTVAEKLKNADNLGTFLLVVKEHGLSTEWRGNQLIAYHDGNKESAIGSKNFCEGCGLVCENKQKVVLYDVFLCSPCNDQSVIQP